MNAIEELRHAAKCCGQTNACYNCEHAYPDKTLSDIADHIEAKYMPYPLDADGVPCKIGDVVALEHSPFVPIAITKIVLSDIGWRLCLAGGGSSARPKIARHVKPKPETIDDVRNEITADWDYAHDLIERAYECGKRDAE